MRKSRTNSSQQSFDALSVSAEIISLGGSLRQMYYATSKSYEDDRKWVPCILYAYAYVIDPANIMSGKVDLSGIEWYNRMPIDGDYTTGRITNPVQSVLDDVDVYDDETGELIHEAAWRNVDFLISDGSGAEWCNGVPAYGLIVHKNVPQLSSMTIYGVIKFPDKRTGFTIRRLKNVDFNTEVYNDEGLSMKGDCSSEILLDPLSFPDTLQEGERLIDVPWMRTVTAQLLSAEGNIDDAEACYLWTVEDSSTAIGWRELTDDEKELLSITTDKQRAISIDARLINKYLRLRCYGCRREEGAEWINPLTIENSPFYEMQFTLTLNDTMYAEPVQVKGAQQGPEMNIECLYEMTLRYNGVDVPQAKRCLFLIHWWAQNLRTGAKVDMGYGPNLIFTPKDYDFSYPDGYNIWADVWCYSHCSWVTQDSKQVQQDNMIVISPQFV